MKENENELEFVYLVLVRMRSCPWCVKQAGNSSAARRQWNFDQRLPHEDEIYKGFYLRLVKSL